MAYTALTQEGKNYIKNLVSGTGNSFLSGKSPYKTDDNPKGVLPYANPPTSPTTIWTSQAKFNGSTLTTNAELADALIFWYNKYGEEFGIDTNIIVAQAIIESGLKVWNYSVISSASSISQFLAKSAFETIIKDRRGDFTAAEKAAISKDLETNQTTPQKIAEAKKSLKTYNATDALGKINRAQMHQNMIDNPQIMIKAQCSYMRNIANKSPLASSVLFGYNRGPDYIRSTYTDTIENCKSRKYDGYQDEGIHYVWKVFTSLYKNFGYNKGDKDLKMNLSPEEAAKTFDDYAADTDAKATDIL